jgi:periplasmic divalent cation tolerance protein
MIYITTKDKNEALVIGRALVSQKLAACINILEGMTSVYHWQGELEESREVVLLAKTDRSLSAAAIAEIKRLHSYAVPCAVVFDIADGNAEYLKWMAGEIKGG